MYTRLYVVAKTSNLLCLDMAIGTAQLMVLLLRQVKICMIGLIKESTIKIVGLD